MKFFRSTYLQRLWKLFRVQQYFRKFQKNYSRICYVLLKLFHFIENFIGWKSFHCFKRIILEFWKYFQLFFAIQQVLLWTLFTKFRTKWSFQDIIIFDIWLVTKMHTCKSCNLRDLAFFKTEVLLTYCLCLQGIRGTKGSH